MIPVESLGAAAGTGDGRVAAAATRAAVAAADAGGRGAGPRRPARPAAPAPRARGRRRRRPQPADGRPARGGQVAGRRPAALDPAAAGRGARRSRWPGSPAPAAACGRGPGGGGRPFRSPHHTISPAGLIGGGNPPTPGEVTLAHRGVLFLDELCEFRRDTLEALRAPLETGSVSIARAGSWQRLPCRFMLVAAANPCPCGRGESDAECSCAPLAVQRYRAKLSGALADRIDIIVAVRQPSAGEIGGARRGALGDGAGAGRRGARAAGRAGSARGAATPR